MNDFEKQLLIDVQTEYTKENKRLLKALVVAIILMFLEAVVFTCCFVYYESQFEVIETEQKTTEVSTEGDNANAEYNENNVTGNQYNDSATHKQETD